MNNLEKINLNKMIDANSVKDCTDEIRSKKHSQKIRDDVKNLIKLKNKYSRLAQTNKEQFDSMCVSQCSFIFNNYMDIFNKVKKDEMNLQILDQLLDVLKQIEDEKIDQHTGAFEVGKLLKTIYIDSALTKAERIDKKTGEKTLACKQKKEKNISWIEYKKQQEDAAKNQQ